MNAWRGKFIRVALILLTALCANVAKGQDTMQDINPHLGRPMSINARQVTAQGLRTIHGQHVTIYTDVPAGEPIEQLPQIFDAAVPQWCEYFGVKAARAKAWKLSAFLIRDKSRFEKAGLIPDDLPRFPAGINRGHEIWLFLQADDYYTRHLLLHEGTHAFMQWFLQGLGAPWYAEGMAELLALHRWDRKELRIHHRVQDSSETEGWGRPRLIRQWVAANESGKHDKALRDILLTPNRAFGDVENYAWCWAACEFLGQHPLSRDRFGALQRHAHRSPEEFNEQFLGLFADDLQVLERDWAWFIRELDYGYSSSRSAFDELLAGDSGHYRLRSDRSWQILDIPVKAGQKFRIEASGRFVIGSSRIRGQAKPWPCEPGGITIEYFRGRPIGEVQMIVLSGNGGDGVTNLPGLCRDNPLPVGFGKVVTVHSGGLLCFRINESPAKMADNRGELKIAIEKVE